MPTAIKEMDKIELVNLERLAYILKRLIAAELETLEILLDEEEEFKMRTLTRSFKRWKVSKHLH